MATKLFNPNLFGFPQFNTGEVAVPKTRLFNRNLFGYPEFNTGESAAPFTGTPYGKVWQAVKSLSASITIREQ
jgi:hypothetical protein